MAIESWIGVPQPANRSPPPIKRTFATLSKEKSGLLTYFFTLVMRALDTLSLLNVLICTRGGGGLPEVETSVIVALYYMPENGHPHLLRTLVYFKYLKRPPLETSTTRGSCRKVLQLLQGELSGGFCSHLL